MHGPGLPQNPYHSHNYHTLLDDRAGNGKIDLLKVCRAIYIETCPLLYTTNAFAIMGISNLETFLYFSKSIRPWRLASIAKMYINTQVECFEPMLDMFKGSKFPRFNEEWTEMWDVIVNRMTGLRFLTVHLKRTYKPILILEPEEAWVKTMLQVRNLRQFRFELSESQNMPSWTGDYKKQVQWLKEHLQATLSSEGFTES